jgi:hypothetical protein
MSNEALTNYHLLGVGEYQRKHPQPPTYSNASPLSNDTSV